MIKKILFSLALLASAAGVWATDDNVTVGVFEKNLDITLNNSDEYVAFQMNIKLPAGISAESVNAAKMRLSQDGSDTEVGGTKFIVASKVIDEENNILRVVAYNLANKAIDGTSGADILKIRLKTDSEVNPSDVQVSKVIFVNKSALASVKLADATGTKGFDETDANRDNYVNSVDINSVLNVMTGSVSNSKGDVNNDGYINSVDINEVLDVMTLGK